MADMAQDTQVMSEQEAYKQYDEFLDDVYGMDQLAELYGGARILKEVDPIAYRVGFADWTDAEGIEVE